MPLKRGGKKAVKANIKELYKANETKSPGNVRPRKQIIAIALSAARRKKK